MRTGTAHFKSRDKAVGYYCNQGYGYDAINHVELLLLEGSIEIGPPETKPGETLSLDADGRYWIEDNKS